jgi:hypothetical protein
MNVCSAWVEDTFLMASPFLGLLLGALLVAAPAVMPDRWDRATVVRVCHDGTKVFRMDDGDYQVRTNWRSYHAESADVCAP